MNLAEWLARRAALSPDSPALMQGARVVADYRAFAASAAGIGGSLSSRFGIAPGDRVAILAINGTEYLEVMYGAWFAGAAVVPINAKLHPREAAWILENSGATIVFVTSELGAAVAPNLPPACRFIVDLGSEEFHVMRGSEPLPAPLPRDRDDMAWLFYTSGTTGKPKGVMISNGNIHAMTFAYLADVDAVHPSDAALYAAPMSHGAGLYNVQHVLKGARHVVPESGAFDTAEILDLAERLGSVHMFAAPTMVRRLVDAAKASGRTGEGIRTVVYGGGPMYFADIVEAVEIMGSRFCQIYGQGESPMTITALPRDLVADRSHPRWKERLASVGTAQSCVEVRVVDPDGIPLTAGETGEVVVRGAAVMTGYWNNPDATDRTLRDGWLWTGDMGALDEDGFLTLKDRSKDLIISGGTNIYPREVEEALLTHPAVREVSVIGRADPEWGEAVVAFVVLAPGESADPTGLDAHCLDLIARFKRPKHYRFVEALPKNAYGKVLKTDLRAMLEAEAAPNVGEDAR
ncbi:long-chain fatty acid--CoA ligase [Aquibium carbonis]|uniref:3-methylmercaptopropionyl-CoA ligase n=1 Tax=Aquibium carbonis TaxID=2495581 RepID=A0A3S0GC75_9HYPH|nr:AMP-binding protein [Aquibium carbonis]RST88472.1 long-chain fatty acid--CoA ligase [Aquibium carbonis]